jgi:hypothetical protein
MGCDARHVVMLRVASDFLALVVLSLEILPPDADSSPLAPRELQRTFLDEVSSGSESDPPYPKRVWIERAMRLLRNGCTKKLLSYGTSIDQDAALVAPGSALPFHIRMLVALRLAEKRNLRQCVRYATNVLAAPELAGGGLEPADSEETAARSHPSRWPLVTLLAAAGMLLILWALSQLPPLHTKIFTPLGGPSTLKAQ